MYHNMCYVMCVTCVPNNKRGPHTKHLTRVLLVFIKLANLPGTNKHVVFTSERLVTFVLVEPAVNARSSDRGHPGVLGHEGRERGQKGCRSLHVYSRGVQV